MGHKRQIKEIQGSKITGTADLRRNPNQQSYIHKDKMHAIIKALEKNTSIHSLVLTGNRLDDASMGYLCEALPKLNHVKTLDVSFCSLTDAAVALLSRALPTTHVETLNISFNQEARSNMKELAQVAIHPTTPLRHLIARYNVIPAESLAVLCGASSRLRSLDCSHCRTMGDFNIVASAIQQNPHLEKVWLTQVSDTTPRDRELVQAAAKQSVNPKLHLPDAIVFHDPTSSPSPAARRTRSPMSAIPTSAQNPHQPQHRNQPGQVQYAQVFQLPDGTTYVRPIHQAIPPPRAMSSSPHRAGRPAQASTPQYQRASSNPHNISTNSLPQQYALTQAGMGRRDRTPSPNPYGRSMTPPSLPVPMIDHVPYDQYDNETQRTSPTRDFPTGSLLDGGDNTQVVRDLQTELQAVRLQRDTLLMKMNKVEKDVHKSVSHQVKHAIDKWQSDVGHKQRKRDRDEFRRLEHQLQLLNDIRQKEHTRLQPLNAERSNITAALGVLNSERIVRASVGIEAEITKLESMQYKLKKEIDEKHSILADVQQQTKQVQLQMDFLREAGATQHDEDASSSDSSSRSNSGGQHPRRSPSQKPWKKQLRRHPDTFDVPAASSPRWQSPSSPPISNRGESPTFPVNRNAVTIVRTGSPSRGGYPQTSLFPQHTQVRTSTPSQNVRYTVQHQPQSWHPSPSQGYSSKSSLQVPSQSSPRSIRSTASSPERIHISPPMPMVAATPPTFSEPGLSAG